MKKISKRDADFEEEYYNDEYEYEYEDSEYEEEEGEEYYYYEEEEREGFPFQLLEEVMWCNNQTAISVVLKSLNSLTFAESSNCK